MKIAVTAKGETIDAPVDPRFGRAATFVLFDTETSGVSAVSNDRAMNASKGAGVQTAEMISRLGVELVITGHCGPNALRALESAGIRVVVGVEGTVREAINQYTAGQLQTGAAESQRHRVL